MYLTYSFVIIVNFGNGVKFQVDAHNIIPCWKTSDKQEYSAKTIRGKILRQLSDYLTKFPPVIKHPHESTFKAEVSNMYLKFDC